MKRVVLFALALALLIVPLITQAHILKLKDGRILKGQLVSAGSDVVYFHVEGDTIHEFAVGDLLSLHFSSASINAAPPQKGEPVKILPGATVRVKLTQELGTKSSDAGKKFFAEMVEDFVVDDVTLSAAGKRVHGRVRKVVKPKRSNDRAAIEILLTDLTIAGKSQPITTDYFGVENDGKGNYNFVGTAKPIDTLLGECMDGKNVRLPVGTVIEFRITQPVTVRHVTK
jgi:hypothetical protein